MFFWHLGKKKLKTDQYSLRKCNVMYILILDNFYVVNPNFFYRVQSCLTDFNDASKKKKKIIQVRQKKNIFSSRAAPSESGTMFLYLLDLQWALCCSILCWVPKGFLREGSKMLYRGVFLTVQNKRKCESMSSSTLFFLFRTSWYLLPTNSKCWCSAPDCPFSLP